MALVSGGKSTLNPNAPLFVPAAFRQVEDFSPEWWQLVTTSTWYHDYWVSLHQGEDGFYDNAVSDCEGNDLADLLPDAFDFGVAEDFSNMEAQFEEFIQFTETERENKSSLLATNKLPENGVETVKSVTTMKSSNDRGPKSFVQPAKYAEKPAKSVTPKSSPRCIQQPR